MNSELNELKLQLDKQKKKIQRLTFLFSSLLFLFISFFIFFFKGNDENRILRTKGLVIVDDSGKERILIGAPLPYAKNRIRTDTVRVRALWSKKFPNANQYMKWYKDYNHQSNGILILDEKGFDKVCLGDGVPDANIGQRIGRQSGLIFCDDEGFERGGLGILQVGEKANRVVLALDGANGTDATGISVLEDGETGFFASGPNGYQMFLGSAGAGSYTSEPFFGMLMNQRKNILYKLNTVVVDPTQKK